MRNIFFSNWESLIRITIVTIVAYFLIIFMLRISGKRTLSKMNAFDFIVTVALGSMLATVILSKDIALFDGLLALVLLITLQYIITWLSARYKVIDKFIKSSPALLVYKGVMLKSTMLKERIDEDEIYATIRKNGHSSISEVDAVILETDGSLTAIDVVKHPNSEIMKNIIKV